MIFAVVLGIPLGFFAAKRYGGAFDHASLVGSLIGISIPIFFLAMILKYIFAVQARLAAERRADRRPDRRRSTRRTSTSSTRSSTGDWAAFWDVLKHLILPAIALGSIPLAIITRITRASVLDVQNEDYVRTARAKGLPPRIVDRRHVLRNALLPVIDDHRPADGLLLSGAVLTETVFAWPGHRHVAREAIFNRDYPVLQGGILFLAIVFVLVNLVVDISYALINPRIRLS